MEARFGSIEGRFASIDQRFDGVDLEIRRLGVMIEDMDSKFTLMSEAQDVILDVLETRVAHIEEILDVTAN